jgi:hypothetical protein
LGRKKLGPCIYLSFALKHNSESNTQNPIASTVTMYMSYSLKKAMLRERGSEDRGWLGVG